MTAAANRIICEWWRVLLSVLLGVVATVGLVVALTILEHVVLSDDSTMSFDEQMSAFWLLTWPVHLWGVVLKDLSSVLVAALLTYVTIFSLAAYLLLRGRGRGPRLL